MRQWFLVFLGMALFYQTSLLGSDLSKIPSKDYPVISDEKQSPISHNNFDLP
jgi:hypothetical protein